MINRIVLENFKCFPQLDLDLRSMTILCGVNSGGKSSVIQGLLMGIESMEGETENIDLMASEYNIDLYSFDEILYEDANDELFKIGLYSIGEQAAFQYKSEESDNNVSSEMIEGKKFIQKVWYLSSERFIHQVQRRGNAQKPELGKENEYIAYVLERGRSNKIPVNIGKNYKDKENILFASQVNEWLDFILPGNQVMGVTEGKDNLVSLKFGKNYKFHKTNIGYGISFVLPIIVSGLLAQKGDILIVENPELHLHPKAQSDLALFLAFIAQSGVQIIMETHSDHIVNGIRKAIVNPECELISSDVEICFFDKNKEVRVLHLDDDAQLSDWPDDFMEQVENDLYYLRKMRGTHGNTISNEK